jgi:hypothetical protein
MGLNLAAGGHLPRIAVNVSGKWFKVVPYNVHDHLIDMDEVARLARESRPKVIIAGGSAYPRIIDFKRFREISDEVGAILMVDMANFAGLVAGGAHPSPFPHAQVVTTTTHKTLRGPRGGVILSDTEELAKKINSAVFPGLQGGPLMHVIAAKAVAFGEALQPSSPMQEASSTTPRCWRRRSRRAAATSFRAAPTPISAGGPAAEAPHRQGRRSGAGPFPHHLQQERHSFRSREARDHVEHSARVARRHHPRLRHREIPRGRRTDLGRARRAFAERRRV